MVVEALLCIVPMLIIINYAAISYKRRRQLPTTPPYARCRCRCLATTAAPPLSIKPTIFLLICNSNVQTLRYCSRALHRVNFFFGNQSVCHNYHHLACVSVYERVALYKYRLRNQSALVVRFVPESLTPTSRPKIILLIDLRPESSFSAFLLVSYSRIFFPIR